VRISKDPPAFIVLFEDSAALLGLLIAAAGTFAADRLQMPVLDGIASVGIAAVSVMGQKLALPVYCSPTALQRLFHYQGERAVAAAAAKYGTMFGVGSFQSNSALDRMKPAAKPRGQLYRAPLFVLSTRTP
jgi:isopentenyl diphosphate isomerase/L-lactate dehydrogenase-like FMN-dependent dehydrogenase